MSERFKKIYFNLVYFNIQYIFFIHFIYIDSAVYDYVKILFLYFEKDFYYLHIILLLGFLIKIRNIKVKENFIISLIS